jgi:hypothetical protein
MISRHEQCSVWGIAFAMLVASGCNLVLDNEKRKLSPLFDGVEAGVPDVTIIDSGPPIVIDAGNDAGQCSGTEFPECAPNMLDTGRESCGVCGSGTRTRERQCSAECRWESWGPWSECDEPASVCMPGDEDQSMEACGFCGLGMRKTTRICTSMCSWSDWMPEACVEDESNCSPLTTMRFPDIPCGDMCGRASQIQTCGMDCKWGPILTGECITQAECKPGATRMAEPEGCNATYCNKGIQQRMQTCTAECTWSAPAATGACTIPEGVCRPMDLGGTGTRCIPNDRGYRQTCALSTEPPANRCTWRGRMPDATCTK